MNDGLLVESGQGNTNALDLQALKMYVILLGLGLPLEERLIPTLATFLKDKMASIAPFQVLLVWHAFAYHNSVQPEFEAAAHVYLDEYLQGEDAVKNVHVKGKAKQVQRLWRYHGRDVQYPDALQQAVDSLVEVCKTISCSYRILCSCCKTNLRFRNLVVAIPEQIARMQYEQFVCCAFYGVSVALKSAYVSVITSRTAGLHNQWFSKEDLQDCEINCARCPAGVP